MLCRTKLGNKQKKTVDCSAGLFDTRLSSDLESFLWNFIGYCTIGERQRTIG